MRKKRFKSKDNEFGITDFREHVRNDNLKAPPAGSTSYYYPFTPGIMLERGV